MYKAKYLLSIFLTAISLIILGSGCSSNANPSETATDYSSFVRNLSTSGLSVKETGELPQEFFDVKGRIININGSDIQVFEYETSEVMRTESMCISHDGFTITRANRIISVDWISWPHFYKSGRIIVIYVGGDQDIMNLLQNILGKQFAGS